MSLHWLPVKRKVDFRILLMTVPRARLKTKVDYYSTVLPLLLWKLKNNFIYILVSLFYCCSCLFLLLYSLLWSMYRCFCCYASSVIKHCLNRLYKWSINSSIQPRCNTLRRLVSVPHRQVYTHIDTMRKSFCHLGISPNPLICLVMFCWCSLFNALNTY